MLKLLYRHNHLLAMCLSMLLIITASVQTLQERFVPCASCRMPVGVGMGHLSPTAVAMKSSLVVSQVASLQLVRAVQILPAARPADRSLSL
jgi:hypothetical protein